MTTTNLIILLGVLILTLAEILVIRYRRSLKRFRATIERGDKIQVRIGRTLVAVIVLNKTIGDMGVNVKQFGCRKSFIVSLTNTYPL